MQELKPRLPLVGLEPSEVATLAPVIPIADGSVQVFYRTPDGTTKERLLGRADEEHQRRDGRSAFGLRRRRNH